MGKIPARQRALVQEELADMYRNNIAVPFQVIGDILKPHVFPHCPVLEIGCASGYYYEVMEYLLKTPLAYTGVDYSEPLIAMARGLLSRSDVRCCRRRHASFLFRAGSGSLSRPASCFTSPSTGSTSGRRRAFRKDMSSPHRTQICRRRPTQFFRKLAYGVETLEIIFQESELLHIFAENGLKEMNRIEYHADPDQDFYEVTYLFEKGKGLL